MAGRPISLDDYRNNLNLRMVIQRLTREGYEESAVRRAIARIRVDGGDDVTMADILVWSRRVLDHEARHSIVRMR